MNPNKHEVKFSVNGLTGFITGVPDKCHHAYDEDVYILGNGDILPVKDYLCPDSQSTMKYLQHVEHERGSQITTYTTRCIACKKIYHPDFNAF